MIIKKSFGELYLTLACWLLVLKISAPQAVLFSVLLVLMGLQIAFMLKAKSKFITVVCWGISFIWWLPLVWFHLWQTLVAQVSLPILWLNFLFKWRYYLLPLGLVCYLLGSYLMLRLSYVFDILSTSKVTLKGACTLSFKRTQAYFPKKLVGILILTGMLHALSWRFGIYLMLNLDLAKHFKFGLVFLNALVVIFSSAYALSYFLQMNKLFLLKEKKFIGFKWLFLLAGLLIFLGQLKTHETTQPIKILAHRGINQSDGVPNTVPALIKTHQQVKVDYAEIDLQITKDHNFVVSHDDNLVKLTNEQLKISQTSLKKLQEYALKQGKNTAYLASFDEYLKTAIALKQPLLVELKPEANWNRQNIKLFLHKYQQNLLKNHALLHTSDYKLLKNVKKQGARIPIGYIEPFTIFKLNAKAADFYSLNANLLTSNLATQTRKNIFVWTINDLTSSLIIKNLAISALITDNSSQVKHWLKNADFPWLVALKEF